MLLLAIGSIWEASGQEPRPLNQTLVIWMNEWDGQCEVWLGLCFVVGWCPSEEGINKDHKQVRRLFAHIWSFGMINDSFSQSLLFWNCT